jgi:[NiFe] hydrogenase assembly HybE family chaperone
VTDAAPLQRELDDNARLECRICWYVYDPAAGDPVYQIEPGTPAIGMRRLDEHEFGVLLTPWFMNLVLLPGSDRWDGRPQGSTCAIELPGGEVEFIVSHDGHLGTTLSAVLFRSVSDFPDQAMARAVAVETLRLLCSREAREEVGSGDARLNRRDLFRRFAAGGDRAQ